MREPHPIGRRFSRFRLGWGDSPAGRAVCPPWRAPCWRHRRHRVIAVQWLAQTERVCPCTCYCRLPRMEADMGSATERILVIDDDRAVLTYLRAVLGGEGYRVFTALDALHGPMVARQERPDLVVLDLAMPGGGGPAVLDRLRMMQGVGEIPVLVYSGLSEDRVADLVPPGPGLSFIAKPGTPDEGLQAVR